MRWIDKVLKCSVPTAFRTVVVHVIITNYSCSDSSGSSTYVHHIYLNTRACENLAVKLLFILPFLPCVSDLA